LWGAELAFCLFLVVWKGRKKKGVNFFFAQYRFWKYLLTGAPRTLYLVTRCLIKMYQLQQWLDSCQKKSSWENILAEFARTVLGQRSETFGINFLAYVSGRVRSFLYVFFSLLRSSVLTDDCWPKRIRVVCFARPFIPWPCEK
jgi:hypothetical protein